MYNDFERIDMMEKKNYINQFHENRKCNKQYYSERNRIGIISIKTFCFL